MKNNSEWQPLGPSIEDILAQENDPLQALSEGRIPAIICRQAYPRKDCQMLIDRFIERGLIRDPSDTNQGASVKRTRIDIGTSLANLGSNKESFLEHAAGTHNLYETLFKGYEDPIKLLSLLHNGLPFLSKLVTVAVCHSSVLVSYTPKTLMNQQ